MIFWKFRKYLDMPPEHLKSTLQEADQLLEAAQNEMFRAAEDVVPYLVCSNARLSTSNYLRGFLIKRGVDALTLITLEQLLSKCQEIEPSFQKLSLEHMNCSSETHDERFCTDLEKVKQCIDFAETTKKMVEDEPWPLSKHVK